MTLAFVGARLIGDLQGIKSEGDVRASARPFRHAADDLLSMQGVAREGCAVQCMISKHLQKPNDQYLSNLGLKMCEGSLRPLRPAAEYFELNAEISS